MSEDGQLAVIEKVGSYLQLFDVVMDVRISPLDKFEEFEKLVFQASSTQIKDETDEDSPWYVSAPQRAAAETLAQKKEIEFVAKRDRIRETAVGLRVFEIFSNWSKTIDIAFSDMAIRAWNRAIDQYPLDGEYQPLVNLLLARVPDSQKGSVRALFQYIKKVMPGLQELDVPAGLTSRIVAERGRYALGRTTGAINRVLRQGLTGPVKKKRIIAIMEDAAALSRPDWEEKYSSNKVPRMSYQEQHQRDGSALFVIRAKSDTQAALVRSRLRDLLKPMEGLFRPVTVERIIEARDTENWDGLIISAARADSECRKVLDVLSHSDGGICDLSYLETWCDLRPDQIPPILNALERWEIVKSAQWGRIKTWQIKVHFLGGPSGEMEEKK